MSPYLTTAEVADRLRFTAHKQPLVSAWKWIKRNELRVYPVGRTVRVLRQAVDDALRDGALAREAGRTAPALGTVTAPVAAQTSSPVGSGAVRRGIGRVARGGSDMRQPPVCQGRGQ